MRVFQIDLVFSVGGRIWRDFSVGMKLIWLLCGWPKLTWFLNAGRSSLVFSVSMQIDLHFVWVVQIDLISVWGSNLTWFQCRMKLNWLLCTLSKMTSFQCGGSALIWFSWSGRKWLVFSARIQINWVIVSGHRNRLDIRVGIKIDLILAMGSKLPWFLCPGSKVIWFWRRDRTWLVFGAGVKIDFGFVCVPKIAWL